MDKAVDNLEDDMDQLYAKTDENGNEVVEGEEGEDSEDPEEDGEILAESMADELADKLVNRVLKTSLLPKVDMETTTLGKSEEAKVRRRLNDELEDDKALADYSDEELESMLHRVGGGTPQAAPARQLIVKAMKAMKVMRHPTSCPSKAAHRQGHEGNEGHEGDDGHEGDEGHEGHEGIQDEEEESEQDCQGQVCK